MPDEPDVPDVPDVPEVPEDPDVPDELDVPDDVPLATHVPARQVSRGLHDPFGKQTAPATPALLLLEEEEGDGSSPTHATMASADDATKATTAST